MELVDFRHHAAVRAERRSYFGYPFVQTSSSGWGAKLKHILERQFYNWYLMGGTPIDTDKLDYREFLWFYDMLVNQREEEKKERSKLSKLI